MSTVYYSLLAGKYYYGLDNIYRANESFVKNVMHTFAVPAAHPVTLPASSMLKTASSLTDQVTLGPK